MARTDIPTGPPARTTAPFRPPRRPPERVEQLRSELVRLDAVRARAFARRDPQLLARVYAAPQLLARDRAMLLAVVPTGCGLDGLRTGVRGLSVVRGDSAGTTVQVGASLGAAVLRCAGRVAGRAPASSEQRMTITLVTSGATVRIAAEHAIGRS